MNLEEIHQEVVVQQRACSASHLLHRILDPLLLVEAVIHVTEEMGMTEATLRQLRMIIVNIVN